MSKKSYPEKFLRVFSKQNIPEEEMSEILESYKTYTKNIRETVKISKTAEDELLRKIGSINPKKKRFSALNLLTPPQNILEYAVLILISFFIYLGIGSLIFTSSSVSPRKLNNPDNNTFPDVYSNQLEQFFIRKPGPYSIHSFKKGAFMNKKYNYKPAFNANTDSNYTRKD